ncbi:dihydrofolate reductase [Aggregicoccus sp. 17bor-14]|uniref:dihydrofolate reductase family protein n=1 Tax=Myxococcaceae TaxID=31 RepID=UPI00129CA7B9|nr:MULTISPECIES: dihydrofolate reductase family protein [Myxococcaceae]MBF5041644.1 dihydrofolate reductase family protein [Simulacricoccus sp. 17bor-14]MRI87428.1 dihydrofolate reductase [Aggregicoccus sp. 17bor-14]
MRRLILGMFVSLDGFVGGPNGENDWVFRSGDDATDAWVIENLGQAGVIAMGSGAFREMADYWPTADSPFAAPMNALPKVVFTRKGLTDRQGGQGSWASPLIAKGELSEEVARLKAQPGKDIRVLGGAGLARSLAAGGLVDEYQLMVCPVALGKGLPLFSELSKPVDLKLASTKVFGSGAIVLTYRKA